MNINDRHKKWLNREVGGHRADLSEADLSRANFTLVRGKRIFTFVGPRHVMTYIDGIIHIGCVSLSVSEWAEKCVDIGRKHGYYKDEIAEYRAVIRLCKTYDNKYGHLGGSNTHESGVL
jgi:hypothetical protein